MRIQHNIAAINSNRQLATNNGAISKNLEKLSSGYKINKAGDDAAGLAISEKMRAQITGLSKAQDNANDGISLVQTAEGALTEVHSMLNRMSELATQSSNGTFDNDTDRKNLQKEVDSLLSEVDRIADSTNFNGIKLLDGNLSEADIAGDVSLSNTKVTTSKTTSVDFAGSTALQQTGDKFSYTVAWKDGDTEKSATVDFTVGTDDKELIAKDGTKYAITDAATGALAAEMQTAVLAELKKNSALTADFDLDKDAGAGLTFTSKESGSAGAVVTALGATGTAGRLAGCAVAGAVDAGNTAAGKDSLQKLDLSKASILAAGAEATAQAISDATFEIDGKKFVLADATSTVAELKNVPSDVNVIKMDADGGYVAANDAANVASEISRVTGKTFTAATAATADANAGIAAGDILYTGKEALKATGEGLTLQIGDTADSFNKLTVDVGSMDASSLGIAGIDIRSQEGASSALDKIKTAINSVSSTRGDLGAIQNRLEHTISNLGVTEENMTSAESRIRDTDMAKEMMEYTKNNILIQASQAMLAQANQLPQGVLQLLG